ncbi:hypothetical protein D0Z08_19595 [Nocardioides immobilis]|uniref:Uncharacterized protein n=1 Tax=Nocardioides immobilis TaxID=2049295 RepID=A0A417XYJ4_9ACTN|nr:hypothetical protein [Nocardioides immobilis]RHW25433.1 hypothetical protein D0Z08_19595 [Nocardioides immobilis]
MLERFTVDVLAEHVATQLLEGEPTPKLVHRFFRKGRRDGKRALDHASVSKLLQDAVQLAASSLVEELVRAQNQTEQRIADLQAEVDAHDELIKPHVPSGSSTFESPGPDTTSETDSGPSAVADVADSSQRLLDALAKKKSLKVARLKEAEAAEVKAREAAKKTALDLAEEKATAARAEIPRLQQHLKSLPAEFSQRFESMKHTGEILWSRYCNGFVLGESKRGSRSSDVETPAGALNFTTPPPLQTTTSDGTASADAATTPGE